MRPPDTELLEKCPQCGCADLFVRKNFPQKLGLLIVIIAAGVFLALAAHRATFYIGAAVLLVAAGIDAILFLFMRKITVCYRCRAEFRDRAVNPKHEGFELATAEKYRHEASEKG